MRVGIGVTTYLRPDCLAKCIESIYKHTCMSNVTLHIADDSIERKGVAFRKNECLRALKDCDYIFLFDDDCHPIKDNWIEFFVNSGENHLLFLNDKLHNPVEIQAVEDIRFYKDCGGVFLYITKEMLNRVGAFDEKYTLWGMEHCDWSIRCNEAKIFMHLVGTELYLYSEDYSNPSHKSSITNEEKSLLFNKNFPKFAKGIERIYIPL